MQSEANQHGYETPNALPSHSAPRGLAQQGQDALVSATASLAKATNDVMDRTGLSNAADGGGIEDGTRKALSSYSAEETALGGEERPA